MLTPARPKCQLRDLTLDELDTVSGGTGNSGGEITITAQLNIWGGISLGPSFSPGGFGSIAPGISGGWTSENGDSDGDGVPDNEDGNPFDPAIGKMIVVNGPPRLTTSFGDMSASQQASWVIAFLYSGEMLYADLVARTNVSGNNPNDPYASRSERMRRLREATDLMVTVANDSIDKIVRR